jgi:hypothetical protein
MARDEKLQKIYHSITMEQQEFKNFLLKKNYFIPTQFIVRKYPLGYVII